MRGGVVGRIDFTIKRDVTRLALDARKNPSSFLASAITAGRKRLRPAIVGRSRRTMGSQHVDRKRERKGERLCQSALLLSRISPRHIRERATRVTIHPGIHGAERRGRCRSQDRRIGDASIVAIDRLRVCPRERTETFTRRATFTSASPRCTIANHFEARKSCATSFARMIAPIFSCRATVSYRRRMYSLPETFIPTSDKCASAICTVTSLNPFNADLSACARARVCVCVCALRRAVNRIIGAFDETRRRNRGE